MVMSKWLENWTGRSARANGDADSSRGRRRAKSGAGHSRRRRNGGWSATAAEVSLAVEVCEERVLLSVTPVITQSQAQSDVTNAQTGYDNAVASYVTNSQNIVAGYGSAMQGHYSTFSNNVFFK